MPLSVSGSHSTAWLQLEPLLKVGERQLHLPIHVQYMYRHNLFSLDGGKAASPTPMPLRQIVCTMRYCRP